MLNTKGKWVAIAEELNIISYNDKLWSYEVEFTGTLTSIDINHCFDIGPHCLDCYVVGQTHYINVFTRLARRLVQNTFLSEKVVVYHIFMFSLVIVFICLKRFYLFVIEDEIDGSTSLLLQHNDIVQNISPN